MICRGFIHLLYVMFFLHTHITVNHLQNKPWTKLDVSFSGHWPLLLCHGLLLIDQLFGFRRNSSHAFPIGSMGRLYIYLHECLIFMVNVGKYTIHGSYGVLRTWKTFQLLPSDLFIIQIEVTFFPLKRSLDKTPKFGSLGRVADG